MKVQKKTKETEKPQKPPKDTMPLCDVKKVLYGLTSSVYTYNGAVVVKVPSYAYYLRIDSCTSNYRSYRYKTGEVYALRDCLIQLVGASQVNTGYGRQDSYFLNSYIIPVERTERQKYRRELSDQLKPFLDQINCCLLDELSKADSFGIRIAEKVAVTKEGDV